MEVLEVKDMSEMAEHILENVANGKMITMYTYYKDAVELIRQLLLHPEVVLKHAEIWDCDWDGYEREYMIEIGQDYDLYISKAMKVDEEKGTKTYWKTSTDVVYLDEYAHSLILSSIQGAPELIEVRVNHENDDFSKVGHKIELEHHCDDCCNESCSKHEESDIHADFFREMASKIDEFVRENDLIKEEDTEEDDDCDDRDEIEIHVYFNGKELSNANPKSGYFDLSELLNYLIG